MAAMGKGRAADSFLAEAAESEKSMFHGLGLDPARSEGFCLLWCAAAAHREDRGREITTRVRMLELISRTDVTNCRIEKIAVVESVLTTFVQP